MHALIVVFYQACDIATPIPSHCIVVITLLSHINNSITTFFLARDKVAAWVMEREKVRERKKRKTERERERKWEWELG